jgi:hypothetical protein
MRIAIYAFDICPVYREGRQEGSEYPEIEAPEELWREYVAALDRFQQMLVEIEQLVYTQTANRRDQRHANLPCPGHLNERAEHGTFQLHGRET